ncbi:MAG: glycosyltransferase family 2 protein [Verrucomicrobiota bacterium]|nr:glycosyltransferase family 2 protein [Verrucomicrobiota bacterium]
MSNQSPLVETLHLSVVVPVHNEEKAIGKFVEGLLYFLKRGGVDAWEIIIVEDASHDRTYDIISSDFPEVKVLRNSIRLGSGAARKRGSIEAGGEFIAWIDGDGTYLPGDLINLFSVREDMDQVIGSRRCDYGKLALLRLMKKWFINRFVSCLWEREIPDLNSGLRVFKRSALLDIIDELPKGFSCTSTATLAALNRHQRVTFIPISYSPRIDGSRSKFHIIFDTFRLWRAIWIQWRKKDLFD